MGGTVSGGRTFVIVGASLAGAKAAETLREEGFDGRIVLVGAEAERPYERPPLSKDYLRGEIQEKPYVHDEGFYAEREIELRTSTRAENIDLAAPELVLRGGERLRFDRLLLATGAEPRRLRIRGSGLDGIHYLRTIGDSEAMRERIEASERLVTIGAGWIGAEVAASARERGCEVTIIEMASVPLERVLGPEMGALYRDLHTDRGVELLADTGVEAFEGDGKVRAVTTTDGRRIEADFVVVGVGAAPRTELADAAGLATENGVLVDEYLQTSAPGVFAAGDVANVLHPLYGERIRVEHWANALHQGPAAARRMLGKGTPYDRVPYFFSDQYEIGMEYAGHATGWDEVVYRGDPSSREFIAFWLRDRRLVASMNVNVSDVTDQIQELIRSATPVDPRRLADPDVPSESLAEGASDKPAGLLEATGRILVQGANYPRRLITGRLTKGEAIPATELGPGDGKIIRVDGDRLAVSRDEEGTLRALSPVCTHLRCLVEWNQAARTWDCPCHGSRFDPEGRVIRGPAKRPLRTIEIPPDRAASS
jgi:3-phenylpropionate/trans-cinnamate dioxygenase ferredoxin reductase component